MSCNPSFLILILIFLFLITSSSSSSLASLPNQSALDAVSSRNHYNHHRYHYYKTTNRHQSCGSLPRKSSQYPCIQFQKMNQQQRFRVRAQPLLPSTIASPPGDDHQIDPRYGVEKRLVPSVPNPLHN